MPADPDVFDNHLAAWDAYLATPWARARYDVVAHVLDETLAQLGPHPLRVLDLGGGDGVDSVRLAAAGHEITIVDQAPGMLGRARASAQRASCSDRCRTVESDLASWRPDRPYDLVLCHFVLQYLEPEDEHQVWRLLRQALRPGGSASVICPNPVSEILRAIYRDGDTELALRANGRQPRPNCRSPAALAFGWPWTCCRRVRPSTTRTTTPRLSDWNSPWLSSTPTSRSHEPGSSSYGDARFLVAFGRNVRAYFRLVSR